MTSAYLDIDDTFGDLTLRLTSDEGAEETVVIENLPHLFGKLAPYGVDLDLFTSSSLDFPREYTSKQHVIEMARALRNHSN